MVLKLYRGDHYLNERTQPGLYRGNGLTSKAFYGKSDPAYIAKQGILDTIRKHINPLTVFDKAVYDVTGYLSFSEDENRALNWAGGDYTNMRELDNDYTETRYLFSLSIPKARLTEISDSIFRFTFPCNSSLKMSNSPDPLNLVSFTLQNSGCNICNGFSKTHSIILIDAVNFLRKHQHISNYKEAYNNSVRDSEWLLLPDDPLGLFKSARIQRADFWSAKHYRLLSESPRDPNYFVN